jgi:hypothetical protein
MGRRLRELEKRIGMMSAGAGDAGSEGEEG